jgi:hypothetical protein
MVIVTNILQKLSSVERKATLIVRNFWQLFPRIFGETSLIVTNIWQKHALSKMHSDLKFLREDATGYWRLAPLSESGA